MRYVRVRRMGFLCQQKIALFASIRWYYPQSRTNPNDQVLLHRQRSRYDNNYWRSSSKTGALTISFGVVLFEQRPLNVGHGLLKKVFQMAFWPKISIKSSALTLGELTTLPQTAQSMETGKSLMGRGHPLPQLSPRRLQHLDLAFGVTL